MHPAPSVILFTTLSGLGFGLLFWLGLGMPASTGWVAFAFFALAYVFAVGGLLASTFHLGHPERALKAFTQWRSSWLSREAWAAVITLVIMAVFGAGRVFLDSHWAVLGLAGSFLCLATVTTTSMIYAQLRSVPRWHSATTPTMFLAYSLAGGALVAGQIRFALPLLLIAGAAQLAHWLIGDRALAASGTTIATATGLGDRGAVRSFEPPHTGRNYLMREFVHVVARRHSISLRIIGLALAVAIPVLALLAPFTHLLAGLAVLSHLAGVATCRWLFFAEAEHVVGFYYGKR